MSYLTDEEERLFTSWLSSEGFINPAFALLEELQAVKIESLVDIDRVAQKISDFHHAAAKIIVTGLKSLPETDPLKRASFLKPASGAELVQIPPDIRLSFLSFCLEKAHANNEHFNNLIHKYQPYLHSEVSSHTRETHYLRVLRDVFGYLEQEKKLISVHKNSGFQNDNSFAPNSNVVRLKKLLAPLEDICSDPDLSISKELGVQLNLILSFLKKEGDTYLQQTEPDEATIIQMGELISDLSQLVTMLINSDISKNSLANHNRLITEFENKFLSLSNASPLLKTAEKMLKEVVKEANSTSFQNIQKLQKNLSDDFLEPFIQLVETIPELTERIDVLKKLYQADIQHRFKMGRSRREIFGALGESRDLLVEAGTLSVNRLSIINKKNLETLLDRARLILEAREIIRPLDIIVMHPKLNPSDPVGKKFHNLYKILQEEIESFLEKGYSKEKVHQKFDQFISEIEVLTMTLVNETLTKEEKLSTVNLLKAHVEEEYSVFAPRVIIALRSLLGEVFTSLLVGAFGFFKSNGDKGEAINHLVQETKSQIESTPLVKK